MWGKDYMKPQYVVDRKKNLQHRQKFPQQNSLANPAVSKPRRNSLDRRIPGVGNQAQTDVPHPQTDAALD